MKKRTVFPVLMVLALGLWPAAALPQNNPKVVMETNFGYIGIELYPEQAPVTVENFLQYVTTGFYDGLLFHRIIPDFMIQGGGYFIYDNTLYRSQTNAPIINESYNGLSNLRGTIAMARTSDPNSATSQFYINHVDNTDLDRNDTTASIGYCVFGRVISGMDVVDAIAQTPTANIGYGFANFPYPLPVYIVTATLAPPGYWLAGDIDNDGIVDFRDFAALAADWSTEGPGDVDGNGSVGPEDIGLFANNWLQTTDWYTQ